MQLHSCGEGDILIGSFFAISPQSSQLGAQNIALGGEEPSKLGQSLGRVCWECAALLKIMELTQLQAEKSGKRANAETVATFA
ncbi:hypothetical protein D9C73_012776 [Collichthys lucidus]|uniref:Uncharacterized protein n=1 Tax=Collichthys lucidus TaxID=240159 RepID=A0A4U5UUG3_COLLU|nr:hypothetical protein D9C73_012776 [Collichthys lucidus]